MCYGLSHGFGGMGMLFGGLVHIAVAALVVMGIIWLFRRGACSRVAISNNTAALEILKTRYAKGDISADEFYRLKKELS